MALKALLRTLLMTMIITLAIASLFTPLAAAEGMPRQSATDDSPHPHGKVGVVRGVVFQDWDEDGERDPEEPTLTEATLSLLDSRGVEVGRYITERDGAFQFEGVQPGEYALVELPPLGYSSLQETKVVITVKAYQVSEVNFANVLWLLSPGQGPAQE